MSEARYRQALLNQFPSREGSTVIQHLVDLSGLEVVQDLHEGGYCVKEAESDKIIASVQSSITRAYATAIKYAIEKIAQETLQKTLKEYTEK